MLTATMHPSLMGVDSGDLRSRSNLYESVVIQVMRNIVVSTNPSSFGFVSALLISAIASILVFREIYLYPLGFRTSFVCGFIAFPVAYLASAAVLHTRKFTFDGDTHRMTVEDRWLLMIHGKRTEYSFSDIREIRLEVHENSNIVIVMHSGKRLNPKTGTFKTTRRLLERIAEVMGKSRSAAIPNRWE